jgi:hypothetical protein
VLRPPDTTNFKRYPHLHEVSCTFTDAEPLDPEVAEQALPVIPEPDGPALAIADFFEQVEVFEQVDDSLGTKFRIRCPWVEEHTGGDPTGPTSASATAEDRGSVATTRGARDALGSSFANK